MIEVLKDEQYPKSLLVGFHEAKKEILIMSYKCDYRATQGSRNVNPLVQELRRARGRGVKVWVILNHEGPHSSIGRCNMKAAAKLHEEGILVKGTPPGRTYHGKLIVVDGAFAWIGSHNFSENSLARNFEVSVLIMEPDAVEQIRQIFLDFWYAR